MTLLEKISVLLKNRNFVSVATADRHCEPHAVPKILLKIDGKNFYLADYAIAKTVENLRVNPRACASFMDLEDLEGYRVSGDTEIIEKGETFEKLRKELDKKLIKLSADRMIEGLRTGKRHQHFELEIPEKVIFIRLKVKEAVRVGSQGELFKEKL